jgi:hypothetical protein
MNDGGNKDGGNVEDVWASNQEEAFTQIRELIVNFPYLGMVSSGVKSPPRHL